MHEAAFANAALPAAARVLGLALRPYSLGHELWLTRFQNCALPGSKEPPNKQAAALPLAVMVCSQSWHQFALSGRRRPSRVRQWIWDQQIMQLDLAHELLIFHHYVLNGSACFRCASPKGSDGSDSGRTLGAPSLLLLHNFVLTLPRDEIENYGRSAWDYPFGLAQMRYAAAAELRGELEIENAMEHAARIAAEEWEREHPESTLKFHPKEEA